MLSPADIAVIGAIALVVFGPDKLPGLARQVGRVTRDLQATSRDFIREIERAGDETAEELAARRAREHGMNPVPDYAATIASRPPKETSPLYDPIAHDPVEHVGPTEHAPVEHPPETTTTETSPSRSLGGPAGES